MTPDQRMKLSQVQTCLKCLFDPAEGTILTYPPEWMQQFALTTLANVLGAGQPTQQGTPAQ